MAKTSKTQTIRNRKPPTSQTLHPPCGKVLRHPLWTALPRVQAPQPAAEADEAAEAQQVLASPAQSGWGWSFPLPWLLINKFQKYQPSGYSRCFSMDLFQTCRWFFGDTQSSSNTHTMIWHGVTRLWSIRVSCPFLGGLLNKIKSTSKGFHLTKPQKRVPKFTSPGTLLSKNVKATSNWR